MKKLIKLILLLVCSFIFLIPESACSGGPDIIVRGSTSVEPLMNALLDAYIDSGNAHIRFDINAEGSAEGITAAKEDTHKGNVIGMSSSLVEPDPLIGGVVQIAWDAVVMIVSENNNYFADDNIGNDEIFKIYTGQTKQFNGQTDGGFIAVNVKEAGSGTRDAFESTVREGAGDIGKTLKEALKDKEVKYVTPHFVSSSTTQMISSVTGNKNAIGYTSLGAVKDNEGIKALKINGVAPDDSTVIDGAYILKRAFYIVTGTASLTERTKDFIRFLNSKEAQDIVLKEAFIRLSDAAERPSYFS